MEEVIVQGGVFCFRFLDRSRTLEVRLRHSGKPRSRAPQPTCPAALLPFRPELETELFACPSKPPPQNSSTKVTQAHQQPPSFDRNSRSRFTTPRNFSPCHRIHGLCQAFHASRNPVPAVASSRLRQKAHSALCPRLDPHKSNTSSFRRQSIKMSLTNCRFYGEPTSAMWDFSMWMVI